MSGDNSEAPQKEPLTSSIGARVPPEVPDPSAIHQEMSLARRLLQPAAQPVGVKEGNAGFGST